MYPLACVGFVLFPLPFTHDEGRWRAVGPTAGDPPSLLSGSPILLVQATPSNLEIQQTWLPSHVSNFLQLLRGSGF